MSDKLRKQARALGDKIRAGEAELKQGRETLHGMMATAVDEGTVGTREFNDSFEEASKPIDALAEQIEEDRRSFSGVMALLGDGQAPTANPFDRTQAGDGAAPLGWGDRFIDSDVYRELKASGRLDAKDSPVGQTDAVRMTDGLAVVRALLTSDSYPLVPQRESEIVGLPQEAVSILNYISIGTADTEVVEWVVQKTRTNSAASVAEGVGAAESAFEWDIVQAMAQEIAHFHASTKRALKDEGQLRSLIDDEMVGGLRVKLQDLIINGGGTGTDFTGLYNTQDILSVDFGGTDVYYADAIHRAITAVRIAGLGQVEPTVIGIHPNDFEKHALSKDANDNYINGGPNGTGPTTIWGLKPLVHVRFDEGRPLVGDFKQAKLWINSDVSLATSDQHEEFFRKRLVAVLASFMGVFGVKRPYAFCEVNLTSAS